MIGRGTSVILKKRDGFRNGSLVRRMPSRLFGVVSISQNSKGWLTNALLSLSK